MPHSGLKLQPLSFKSQTSLSRHCLFVMDFVFVVTFFGGGGGGDVRCVCV